MSEVNKKYHWYHVCVMFQVGTGVTYKSGSYGFSEQKVTVARMNYAKANLGAPEDSVIVSASYLGLMTREEFEG